MKNQERNARRKKNFKFGKINNIKRKNLETEYYVKMQELFLVENMNDGFHKYDLGKEEDSYIRYVTDEELRQIIKLAIDMLEEMKVINNSGVNRTAFDKILNEEKAKGENKYLQTLFIWESMETDKMKIIIKEIDKVARVGGAWALIVGNPGLRAIAYGVYDKLADDFNNEEWYWLCGFYLTQAIMRMYGNEK